MRKTLRGAATVCVGALLASLFALVQAATARSATYPPTTCATISVSTTTPRPGETINVTGKLFKPGVSVTLTMTPFGITLATVTTDASGSFSAQVTLPTDARGNQQINANGAGQVCPADPIQITINSGGGSGGPGGGTPPALTGTDIALLAGIALALLTAGVVFARGGKRSRPRAARH